MFNFFNLLGIVCIMFMGRLGNLMLEYVFLYVMVKLKGLYLIILEDFNFFKIFFIYNIILFCIGLLKDVCLKFFFYKECWGFFFDEYLFNILWFKRENYRFYGYF